MDVISNSMKDYLVAKAAHNKVPISGTFELTPLCNLNCKMCYISEKKQEVEQCGGLLPADFWLDVAKDAVDNGMLFLLLTGGEPFLYPDFLGLYEKFLDMGLYVSLNTNGTLLNDEIIRFLEKRPPRKMNISIYGASEETYEKLCGNGSGFGKLMRNLEILKHTSLPVRLRSVLQPENYGDYKGMADIVETLGMPLSYVSYTYPPVRRDQDSIGENHRFSAREAGKIKARYEKDRRSRKEYEEYLCDIRNSLKNYKDYEAYGNTSVNCQGCKAGFWLNWKGELTSCGMLNEPVVDLKKVGFLYGWQKIRDELDTLHLPQQCAVCPKRKYCNLCIASITAETGGYDEPGQYLCEMTDSFLETMNSEYERIFLHNEEV